MDCPFVIRPRHHLHSLAMLAIASNDAGFLIAGEQHFVPRKQCRVVKRCAEIAIEIHHHLGDTALRRIDAGLFRAEAELVAQRGLNAIAIQNLALDFRCLDRLFTDDVSIFAQ